jgi:oligoribonuclease NrnB/cAMP/cGMP phosphodiesterase (DHH superfamily)
MSDELIVFTHNDLDALGCMLNLEFKFPNIKKKYFHTNYANIVELTDQILDHQKENGNTHIVMPDVSFSDNKDSLRRIYEAFPHCTHIDHHLYADGFWDEFPNMKVVWDKTKCATKLCNEYLGNKGQNQNLDKLTYLIDVYDLWQDKNIHFDTAQDMNDYFWSVDIEWMKNEIVKGNYALPRNYIDTVNKTHIERMKAIESYEKRNLIHRAGEVTVAFVQDWFNHILISEMRQGKNFVIGVNSYGIVKVRINQDAPYSAEQLNQLRLELTGTENIGHMHAFTYKVKGQVDFNAIMAEVKKVTEAIQRTCNENRK